MRMRIQIFRLKAPEPHGGTGRIEGMQLVQSMRVFATSPFYSAWPKLLLVSLLERLEDGSTDKRMLLHYPGKRATSCRQITSKPAYLTTVKLTASQANPRCVRRVKTGLRRGSAFENEDLKLQTATLKPQNKTSNPNITELSLSSVQP